MTIRPPRQFKEVRVSFGMWLQSPPCQGSMAVSIRPVNQSREVRFPIVRVKHKGKRTKLKLSEASSSSAFLQLQASPARLHLLILLRQNCLLEPGLQISENMGIFLIETTVSFSLWSIDIWSFLTMVSFGTVVLITGLETADTLCLFDP